MLARIILGGAAAAAALFLSGCRREDHPDVSKEAPPRDLRLPTSKFIPPQAEVAPPAKAPKPLQLRATLFSPGGAGSAYVLLGQGPSASILAADASTDTPLPASSAATGYYKNRDFKEAISAARQELSSEPQNSALYFILGASQGQEQKFEEAAQSLETALQLSPNNAQAHFALGSCYLKMHQAEAGVFHLK